MTKSTSEMLLSVIVKNTIETAIEKGIITGDVAEKWKRKVQEKQKMQELLAKAENGDVKSMDTVALSYLYGIHGFAEDSKKGFEWSNKARAGGSVRGLYRTAALLYECAGEIASVTNDEKLVGLIYVSLAAGKGLDVAAAWLGDSFCGQRGFEVDTQEAVKWYTQSLDGSSHIKCMSEDYTLRVKQKLQDLLHPEDEHIGNKDGVSDDDDEDGEDSDEDADSEDSDAGGEDSDEDTEG